VSQFDQSTFQIISPRHSGNLSSWSFYFDSDRMLFTVVCFFLEPSFKSVSRFRSSGLVGVLTMSKSDFLNFQPHRELLLMEVVLQLSPVECSPQSLVHLVVSPTELVCFSGTQISKESLPSTTLGPAWPTASLPPVPVHVIPPSAITNLSYSDSQMFKEWPFTNLIS